MHESIKIICVILTMSLFLNAADAQTRSFGTTFSYGGSGFIYEQQADDGDFWGVQLRAETTSMFSSRSYFPGISASFMWNIVFATVESRNGNMIRFFAGPGVSAGHSHDVMRGKGFFFGIKGRVGGECTFSRNIAVSLSLSPVLGAHFDRRDGMVSMLLFRSGILYGIMPEVGLKYVF